MVIDIHELKSLHMGIIKFLLQTMQTCSELTLQFALVGNPQIVAECKGFEDTRSWNFYDSIEDARSKLGQAPAAATAQMASA